MKNPEPITVPPDHVVEAIRSAPDFPGGYHAICVIEGRRRISGSDLKGKAKRFARYYHDITSQVIVVAARYRVMPKLDPSPHGLLVWHYDATAALADACARDYDANYARQVSTKNPIHGAD